MLPLVLVATFVVFQNEYRLVPSRKHGHLQPNPFIVIIIITTISQPHSKVHWAVEMISFFNLVLKGQDIASLL